MKFSVQDWLDQLPRSATTKWPHGVFDIEAFAHGSMSLQLFAPKHEDFQTPHAQDELYIIHRGVGVLEIDGETFDFVAGDVLFVPAGKPHKFLPPLDDLVIWVVFYGKDGGEAP